MRRGAIAVAVLIAGAIANPVIASRVLENMQSKGTADQDFAHVVENRSGIITVDTDGTVFGNGMYDGRFNTDLKNDLNGIIRPYALSLFHPAPRDVLMIGLSSGSWAQVIANNPAVASLTIVEINRGYLELIKRSPTCNRSCAIRRSGSSRMTAAAGSVITPRCASMRSSRTRPGISAPTSPTCSRWSFSNSSSSTSIPAACSSTTRPTRAARSGRLAPRFAHGARFTNHMVVSQTPIAWDFCALADGAGELPDRRQGRIRPEGRRGPSPGSNRS